MNRPRLKAWQWALLILAVVVATDWFIQRPDARARQLNDILEAQASPALKAYPYRFRVLRMEANTAVMSTPRNVDVPAFRALGALFPDLNVRDPDNPAFIAAQQTLGAVQAEARQIVIDQGVAGVRWELDQRWLNAHGIDVPVR